MASEIKVGDYLFLRLKELGVKTVFGVPGGQFERNTRQCILRR